MISKNQPLSVQECFKVVTFETSNFGIFMYIYVYLQPDWSPTAGTVPFSVINHFGHAAAGRWVPVLQKLDRTGIPKEELESKCINSFRVETGPCCFQNRKMDTAQYLEKLSWCGHAGVLSHCLARLAAMVCRKTWPLPWALCLCCMESKVLGPGWSQARSFMFTA